ncbi:MAG: hypothetical protein B1H03_01450 [Planctomycetales bacterium 4484_113]|nr:MAG: hypothetical protein B1H03_01450 [Planctomycetales bacterium 4484_113]
MNYQSRIDALRHTLASLHLDALLVSYLPNIFYLSGFTGTTAWILVGKKQLLFLTDSRYHERFREEVFPEYELVDFYQESVGAKLSEVAKRFGWRRVGFEAQHLSYAEAEEMRQQAAECELSPRSGIIESMRLCKDEEEITRIREAIRIKEEVFQELMGALTTGVTEADMAAEFEYRIRKRGVQAASFSPIIAFGPNSAKPHAGFSEQELIPGVPLTFDLGVVYEGYCSDMTRTVFYGGASPGWEEIYGIVRNAKESAAAAAAPGVACAEVDRVARDLITAEGYGSNFGHGLGHGVGVEVHEQPRVNSRSKEVLQPGMVFTIEPGIYVPGQGGIRIEDMYLVTERRVERLNALGTDVVVIK